MSVSGDAEPVPVLVLSGPVGVGKTAVADQVSERLQQMGVPHAQIDIDALGWCYPRPAGDPHAGRLRFQNLAAVWANFARAGARRAIVAAVVESRSDIDRYRGAIPGAEVSLVELRAPVAVLHERLRHRMPGPGLEWHLARAAELAAQMDSSSIHDHLVETGGRLLDEIALEVLERVGWR